MRDYRDAKVMARALRDALNAKAIETTHAEALELIAKAFGYENWNILSAKIEAAERPAAASTPLPAEARHDPAQPKIVYCSFCGKSQHQVLTVVAGPSSVFICDECVDLCTDIVEPDKDKELFELVAGTEESGRADSALLERARRMSTEELAFYVERGRKGQARGRLALQYVQDKLATWNREASADDDVTQEDLVAMQQKAQREVKRYEAAVSIATTALGERRQ
jgi:hypothetical protein